jgi:replicative DNA helicase
MNAIARNAAAQCLDNECVVIANWEDSVEDNGIWNLAGATQIPMTAIERGELTPAQLTKLEKAAIQQAKVPIFWAGHSDVDLRRRDRMTILDVWKLLESLVDEHKRKPVLVVLDYLQRIKPHTKHDHRLNMMAIVDAAKDMSIAFNVPILLGTQAGRALMSEAAPRIPKMHHAQETSNIEQSASAFISCCFPIKTIEEGEQFSVGGKTFTVTPNLLIVSILKQKRGPAPIMGAFNVDFSTHKLYPVE